MCPLQWYIWADQFFFRSYIRQHIRFQLMFSKLDRSGQLVETNTISTLRITMGGNNFLPPHVIGYPLPPCQRNNFQNIMAIGVGRRLEIKLNG